MVNLGDTSPKNTNEHVVNSSGGEPYELTDSSDSGSSPAPQAGGRELDNIPLSDDSTPVAPDLRGAGFKADHSIPLGSGDAIGIDDADPVRQPVVSGEQIKRLMALIAPAVQLDKLKTPGEVSKAVKENASELDDSVLTEALIQAKQMLSSCCRKGSVMASANPQVIEKQQELEQTSNTRRSLTAAIKSIEGTFTAPAEEVLSGVVRVALKAFNGTSPGQAGFSSIATGAFDLLRLSIILGSGAGLRDEDTIAGLRNEEVAATEKKSAEPKKLTIEQKRERLKSGAEAFQKNEKKPQDEPASEGSEKSSIVEKDILSLRSRTEQAKELGNEPCFRGLKPQSPPPANAGLPLLLEAAVNDRGEGDSKARHSPQILLRDKVSQTAAVLADWLQNEVSRLSSRGEGFTVDRVTFSVEALKTEQKALEKEFKKIDAKAAILREATKSLSGIILSRDNLIDTMSPSDQQFVRRSGTNGINSIQHSIPVSDTMVESAAAVRVERGAAEQKRINAASVARLRRAGREEPKGPNKRSL